MMMRSAWIGCFALIAAAGCSSAPDEPESAGANFIAPVPAVPSASGYVHAQSRSRFETGPESAMATEDGRDVVRGSWGRLTTWKSGRMAALLDSDAPARSARMLLDAEVHNQAARAYFVGAGLPEDQIDAVVIHGTVAFSGPSGSPEAEVPRPVDYTTLISRQVRGIPVAESHAWVTFTADGRVVREAVFWPAIPAAVMAAAERVDGALRAGSLRSAGADAERGARAAIHHSSGFGEEARFIACADVVRSGLGARECVGEDGVTMNLDGILE